MSELGSEVVVVIRGRVAAVDGDHVHVELPANEITPRAFVRFNAEDAFTHEDHPDDHFELEKGERQHA